MEKERRKLMIGIPVHNDKECFIAMIKSLMNSTITYDKIVIIESASTDGVNLICDSLSDLYEHFEVIHTKKEGPLKAYNRLFEYAKKHKMDLFLTQTDVLFPKLYKRDWLREMYVTAEKPGCCMVTCINGGGVSGPEYKDKFKWVGGWCTYVPLRTIERIGGYDEKFPSGYGVDIDYTMSAQQGGVIFITNYWVDHHQMNAREHDNSPKAQKQMKASAKYFREKWKDELD